MSMTATSRLATAGATSPAGRLPGGAGGGRGGAVVVSLPAGGGPDPALREMSNRYSGAPPGG